VPYLGVPAEPAVRVPATAGGHLGPANSPHENDLVNELLAPATGKPAAALPDWSSLLAGPALRGTEVTLG
jgi:phospholipid/cholesterol/gamma-HCH transport system substrate-binding protein